jgi:hypothetical protein
MFFQLTTSPREGSSRLLPGLCSLESEFDGTTMYTIEKGFEHTGQRFTYTLL